MKLKNTTDFPDHYLRRMTSWCCRQLGLPPRQVRRARFTLRTWAYSGRAWFASRRILVRIQKPDVAWIATTHKGAGGIDLSFPDRVSALVYVTGHELAHIHNFVTGIDRSLRRSRDLEPHCDRQGKRLMLAFQADRSALESAWSAPIKERAKAPATTAVDRRAAKAQADLDRWQRKLKLAQTKVRKARTRVRYYERKQAATRSEDS